MVVTALDEHTKLIRQRHLITYHKLCGVYNCNIGINILNINLVKKKV